MGGTMIQRSLDWVKAQCDDLGIALRRRAASAIRTPNRAWRSSIPRQRLYREILLKAVLVKHRESR
jgi:hypothetical protein